MKLFLIIAVISSSLLDSFAFIRLINPPTDCNYIEIPVSNDMNAKPLPIPIGPCFGAMSSSGKSFCSSDGNKVYGREWSNSLSCNTNQAPLELIKNHKFECKKKNCEYAVAQVQDGCNKNKLILPFFTDYCYEITGVSDPGLSFKISCDSYSSIFLFFENKKCDGEGFVDKRIDDCNNKYLDVIRCGVNDNKNVIDSDDICDNEEQLCADGKTCIFCGWIYNYDYNKCECKKFSSIGWFIVIGVPLIAIFFCALGCIGFYFFKKTRDEKKTDKTDKNDKNGKPQKKLYEEVNEV